MEHLKELQQQNITMHKLNNNNNNNNISNQQIQANSNINDISTLIHNHLEIAMNSFIQKQLTQTINQKHLNIPINNSNNNNKKTSKISSNNNINDKTYTQKPIIQKNISKRVQDQLYYLYKKTINTTLELHKYHFYEKIIHLIIPNDVKRLTKKKIYNPNSTDNTDFKNILDNYITTRNKHLNELKLQTTNTINKLKKYFNTTIIQNTTNNLILEAINDSKFTHNKIWKEIYTFAINSAIKLSYNQLNNLDSDKNLTDFINIKLHLNSTEDYIQSLIQQQANQTTPNIIKNHLFKWNNLNYNNKKYTILSNANKKCHIILHEALINLNKELAHELHIQFSQLNTKLTNKFNDNNQIIDTINTIITLKKQRKLFRSRNNLPSNFNILIDNNKSTSQITLNQFINLISESNLYIDKKSTLETIKISLGFAIPITQSITNTINTTNFNNTPDTTIIKSPNTTSQSLIISQEETIPSTLPTSPINQPSDSQTNNNTDNHKKDDDNFVINTILSSFSPHASPPSSPKPQRKQLKQSNQTPLNIISPPPPTNLSSKRQISDYNVNNSTTKKPTTH